MTFILPSPIGNIRITLENDVIVKVDTLVLEKPTTKTSEIATQIQAYFSDSSYTFSLKLKPAGTTFQQRVWQALTKIPAGTTLTYGELAKKLKSSPRAVGQACKRNPIPIIIPCHRVVGANSMGGYAGQTQGKLADIKKWLLQHESNNM